MKKFATKAMLAVALLGAGGAIVETVSHVSGQDTASAASYPVTRQWEYKRVGRRIYCRSVLKGYSPNVGWVYDSVGPWIQIGM